VDRIHSIRPTGETFEVPADFSDRDYLLRMAEERPQAYFHIAFCFDADVADLVRERREDWQELGEHGDGSVTLSFDASDLAWPCRWVLTYQDKAKVVAPPELAVLVRDAAWAIAARCADDRV
jgi:predicted DNA-binding transcriptional regulator YafY